ncbi:MAG TPA: CehA/McbA family metallohydrolase [Polyangiaceae bacterium]|nr:CehA/McbA family metallohydrolase [Polyangiaceae bacterium]
MRVAFGLLAVGLAGGMWIDGATIFTEPPIVERAGYRVIEADLHVHTRYSDGVLSPLEVVLTARRAGLDAVAVTEHNMVLPAKMAAWFARLIDGPTVIVGEEVTSRRYHMLAFGLHDSISARADAREVVAAIRAQGGVAIAAHPVARFRDGFEGVELDGAEVVHPIAFGGGNAIDFRWSQMVEFYEHAYAADGSFTAVGASDYHFFRVLGLCRTYIFARDDSEAELVNALRDGRTVAVAPDGTRFGDPALASDLDREALRPPRVGYAPAGWFDAVTRSVAWLGMLALVVLRKRSSSASARH